MVVRWYNGGRAAVVTRGVRMKEKKAAPRGMGEWGKKEGRGEGGKGWPIAMKKKKMRVRDAGSGRRACQDPYTETPKTTAVVEKIGTMSPRP